MSKKLCNYFFVMFLVFALCSVVISISLIILPSFRDSAFLSNESHSTRLLQQFIPLMGYKYILKEDNHLYLILLYVVAIYTLGGATMTSTGVMLLAYLKHACGMFRIASYRIEKALTLNTSKDIILEKEMYKGIVCAVDIHRKAIRFSAVLFSSFHISYFWLVIIGVLSLSLNLYGIFEAMSFGNDLDQLAFHTVNILIIFVYMSFGNYAGQDIIDHNNNLFRTIYNVHWYITPLKVQRLILFLLQRGSISVGLTIGGLFIASLELLASLIKASVSYFTVMYSTQQ